MSLFEKIALIRFLLLKLHSNGFFFQPSSTFLRDYKADLKELNRTYFPNLVNKSFDDTAKKKILNEIKDDFAVALKGIYMLPNNSKFGVYAAYKYYKRLLKKLDKTSSSVIKNKRVRVPNYQKVDVLARSYVRYRLNIL